MTRYYSFSTSPNRRPPFCKKCNSAYHVERECADFWHRKDNRAIAKDRKFLEEIAEKYKKIIRGLVVENAKVRCRIEKETEELLQEYETEEMVKLRFS